MRIFWLKWGCSCCLLVSCSKTLHKFQLIGRTKHTVPTSCGLLRKKDISIHSASFTILRLETVWNSSKYRAITKTRVFIMFEVFHISIIYFLALMSYYLILADFHHSVLKLTLVQQCYKAIPCLLLPDHTIEYNKVSHSSFTSILLSH